MIKNPKQGATLVETLLYATLIAITIAAILYSVYGLINNSKVISDNIIVEEEANFLIKKMEWALIGFDNIASPAAGASASSLSVNKYNYASNPVVFDLNSGIVRIKEGAGEPVSLNSSRVVVTNLNFTHIAASGASPNGIQATFNIGSRAYKIAIYKKK